VPELTDEKIMLRVKEGHLSELTELFERYHIRLYNFFLRLTLDEAGSQDLVQNLFYRLIRYRQSWQPESGSFQSWIFRMARNVHADFYRTLEKMPDRPAYREAVGEDTGASGDEEESADGRGDGYDGAGFATGQRFTAGLGFTEDHFERLERAMAQLQPAQREVLVLSRYEGMKYEEIARIRDSTVAAIKVQVHRAIKQLRTLYFKRTQL
jgi:RNA polymerase sigma factor (sigma-70 family)